MIQKNPRADSRGFRRRTMNELVDSKSATGIEKTQTIFLEGQNMIKDAVNAGVELKSVYATEKILLERLQLGGGVNQYLTRNKTLKDWVSKQAVQSDGIICAVAKKPIICETESADKLPVTVVLDRIMEPWTAGVLLKTARGIGCARFATTKGCCNLWDPVVLTASEGSHFHMAIETNLSWNKLSECIDDNCMVVLASARQIVWKGLQKAEKNFLEDLEENIKKGDECLEENLLQECSPGYTRGSIFPVTNFTEVDFSDKNHIILIVSDDTLKVSKQKLKFLQENNAVLVSIPMVTGISKLNPVVAGVVLMYKIQNQLVSIKP
ncbi:rRNA methyltransferase 3, mitochondrial-like isoform X2 [Ostrea edulis]|uniref:rRNA methyltransferase 3, mitochondrial-like isoform X2 n=1 Tax=Ostrea edulis TaxID=37623 RepID=UPI0024AE8D17|nr:rRNA methyltransferase 3, mitochondrial-like isoform X2 [Ostrea edulis]